MVVFTYLARCQTWGIDWFCPELTYYEFPLIHCNLGWFECECGGSGGSRARVTVECYADGGVAFCGWSDRAFIWYGFPTCPTDLEKCLMCNDATSWDNAETITCNTCVAGYEDPGTRCTSSRHIFTFSVYRYLKHA